MNIIKSIRELYYGPYQDKTRFIPIVEPEIMVEDYITYVEPHEVTSYSIIEGIKCAISNFDLATSEWIFKPCNKKMDIEFRFVDISHIQSFAL